MQILWEAYATILEHCLSYEYKFLVVEVAKNIQEEFNTMAGEHSKLISKQKDYQDKLSAQIEELTGLVENY